MAEEFPSVPNVGGKTAFVPANTITVTASAYAAGNVVGGILTFPNALLTQLSGVLQNASAIFNSVQTSSFYLFIFNSSPSGTYTDKTAPTWSTSDRAKLLTVVSLSSSNSGLGTMTQYQAIGISYALSAVATSLYGVLIANAAFTPASTSDLTVSIGMLQD